ncbi:hypothetical protein ACHAXR_001454, partial [Thalassiosira sp. AJA248-18]
KCPDGTLVGRNPSNKCRFYPCPPESPQEQTTAATPTKPARKCPPAKKECPGGKFVSQDPSNGCKFFPCPDIEVPQAQSSSGSKQSLASSVVSSLHGKNNYMTQDSGDDPKTPKPTRRPTSNQPKCKNDKLECVGGGFVGRDPSRHCKFFKCPAKEEPKESMAASISSSVGQDAPTNEQGDCTDDLKICPDGSFVDRDPDNNCKFFPCSTMQPFDASISSSSGQEAPDYYNNRCEDDVIRCPDGSFVARDPDNGCDHFPCSTSVPLAASISSSSGQEAPAYYNNRCEEDIIRCPDGSFVARDPDNGCDHFPCSTSVPLAASISSSSGQEAPAYYNNRCEEDIIRCPDGSFVARDPDNECNHFPCATTNAATMAGSAMHAKYNDAPLQCANDLFTCADGHYVGRDPDDDCNWYPCNIPPTKRPTRLPTSNGLNTMSSCTRDLHGCSDGTMVGRDPNNSCEFYRCPDNEGHLTQMTQVMETYTAGGGEDR